MNVHEYINYRFEKTAKLTSKLRGKLKDAGFDYRNKQNILADSLTFDKLPNFTPEEYSRVKRHYHGRQAARAISAIPSSNPKYRRLLQFGKRRHMREGLAYKQFASTPLYLGH